MIPGPSGYCREIEAYLCRKNEGHLIRIVGPAFEQVCGWAQLGVPLKIAFRGIDQYCERYYAKGPRRRPVRIEFCEPDILDLFDAWRRAVGVAGTADSAEPAPRKPSLAAHVERASSRLLASRGSGSRSAQFSARVDAVVRELDGLADRGEARTGRGARAACRTARGARCRPAGCGRPRDRSTTGANVEARGGGGTGAVRLADGARGSRSGGWRGSPAAGA